MQIIKGKRFPPSRIVVYGPSGVGKSTWACSAQGALALDYESGLEQVGVDRVTGASTWSGTMALLREACGPGGHSALVVDTLDRIEEQATEEVCRIGVKGKSVKSLADFGYGDGYEAVSALWRELLGVLEGARQHGRDVILVAHVQKRTEEDPVLGKYDKYVAALQKRTWGSTHRWADAVLFADYERGLVEGRAIFSGARVLHTVAGTGFDAKNRWGLAPVLPLSWEAFSAARASASRTSEEMRGRIRSLLTPETSARGEELVSSAGEDVSRLVAIEVALLKKLSEGKGP